MSSKKKMAITKYKVECFNSKFCKRRNFRFRLITSQPSLRRNYILLRKDNTLNGKNENENEPDVNYVLFNLRSLTTGSYANEKLIAESSEQGLNRGRNELKDLEDSSINYELPFFSKKMFFVGTYVRLRRSEFIPCFGKRQSI